jgi:hypothetical protein
MTSRIARAAFALALLTAATPSFAGYAEWGTEEQPEETYWFQALCGIIPMPAYMCDNTEY